MMFLLITFHLSSGQTRNSEPYASSVGYNLRACFKIALIQASRCERGSCTRDTDSFGVESRVRVVGSVEDMMIGLRVGTFAGPVGNEQGEEIEVKAHVC